MHRHQLSRRSGTLSEVPGYRRRAFIRKLIGRPGSVRRWLLGTLIALPLAMATLNLYLVISVVLFSTMWIMYLRTILVEGDEDEMRAWIRWQHSRKNPDRFVPNREPEEHFDSADWLGARAGRYVDVPPPPIALDADEELGRIDPESSVRGI